MSGRRQSYVDSTITGWNGSIIMPYNLAYHKVSSGKPRGGSLDLAHRTEPHSDCAKHQSSPKSIKHQHLKLPHSVLATSIYPLNHEIENTTWLVKVVCVWAKSATYFKHTMTDINLLPLFILSCKEDNDHVACNSCIPPRHRITFLVLKYRHRHRHCLVMRLARLATRTGPDKGIFPTRFPHLSALIPRTRAARAMKHM